MKHEPEIKKRVPEIVAAEFLGCSVHKLQRDRRIGSPIPYIKIGRSVRYDIRDLEKYLEQQKFTSTSEYKR